MVTAPTGSGKTVLFELAILQLFMRPEKGGKKALYLAPTKALCREKLEEWNRRFQVLKIKIGLMTGDSQEDDIPMIQDNDLIIATPEKWDAVSRRLSGHLGIVMAIRLVMVDEVHLLHDQSRGHVLEALLCRLKMLGCPARFVAVSATFPNIEDVGHWLGGPNAVVFKVN